MLFDLNKCITLIQFSRQIDIVAKSDETRNNSSMEIKTIFSSETMNAVQYTSEVVPRSGVLLGRCSASRMSFLDH